MESKKKMIDWINAHKMAMSELERGLPGEIKVPILQSEGIFGKGKQIHFHISFLVILFLNFAKIYFHQQDF